MLLVGLTGGIGAGKSTVAEMLQRRGAVIVDADDLARRAVEPGTSGYARVRDAFGDIITSSGEIDRERLAQVVFADAKARRTLESIVHPEVARLFTEAIEPYRNTDRIVVYVVPLLVERALEDAFDVIVAVAADPELRVARLTSARPMSEKDVRDRMSAQLSDQERERAAHVVIRNEGSLEDLDRAVADLWADLERRARGPEQG